MLQSSAFTTLKMRHKIAKPFHVECVVYTNARIWSINPVVSNTKQRNFSKHPPYWKPILLSFTMDSSH